MYVNMVGRGGQLSPPTIRCYYCHFYWSRTSAGVMKTFTFALRRCAYFYMAEILGQTFDALVYIKPVSRRNNWGII